jgi:putative ABC transport system permease protein
MSTRPPKWIDRLLAWYCNPDLLEEIQGDAYELYEQRVKTQGRPIATIKYLWDVVRFFRWSNMARSGNDYRPGFMEVLLNLNLKIAARNARRNKVTFAVKAGGLAVCVAFTLALSAFVVHELTFEHVFPGYSQIYRIGSRVESNGVVTTYAVSPLPLSAALRDEMPEIEQSARMMGTAKPQFTVADVTFHNIPTFTADSSFLKIFTFKFITGDHRALDEPNKVVLTRSVATRLFGRTNIREQTVTFHETELEVAAVIEDPPARTHLQFGALISWDTYMRNDVWDNVNAYTYVKVAAGTDRASFEKNADTIEKDYLELIAKEYELKFESVIQRVDEIHLSPPMDEDFAARTQINNLYILETVIFLFLITGLINYLNISQAEIAVNAKKHSILRVFGGIDASKAKVGMADALLCLAAALPLVGMMLYFFLRLAGFYLDVVVDPAVWTHPWILCGVALVVLGLLTGTHFNSSSSIVPALRGDVMMNKTGIPLRSTLVAGQLTFSVFIIALMAVIVDQFRFITEADKGFTSTNTLVIPTPSFDAKASRAFIDAAGSVAGVEMAEGCSYVPGGGIETKEFFEIESGDGMRKALINYLHTGHNYLELLNIPLVDGRAFDRDKPADLMGSYLINEAAAKQFGWTDPIGMKINGPLEADGREGQVIGVVRDFHYSSVHNRIEPLIIFLNNNWDVDFIYVKLAAAHPSQVLLSLEDEFKNIFPDSPMGWTYLDDRYMNLYREDNRIRNVVASGLVISLVVSCLGIFSMSALLLVRRTKEMGIRKVVGASGVELFFLHLRTFLVLLAVAVLVAGPLSYLAGTRWLTGFAYHIDLTAWHLIVPALISFAIIFFTAGVHAWRAAFIRPADVLKDE